MTKLTAIVWISLIVIGFIVLLNLAKLAIATVIESPMAPPIIERQLFTIEEEEEGSIEVYDRSNCT